MGTTKRQDGPRVFVAGAGLAGLAATHRLLERGYNVTLIEANDFIGGNLSAHHDVGAAAGGTAAPVRTTCDVCRDRAHGCLRSSDWHEHCYHMYLNWYHNFWEIMAEIGCIDNFRPEPSIFNIYPRDTPGGRQPPISLVNMGSPWTFARNLVSGYAPLPDMFLLGQTSTDLIAEPARRHGLLERTSISAFLQSRGYATEASLAGTYRTTAQAFASPSYLSSARSFKALLGFGFRLPEPWIWLLRGPTEEMIFTPWCTFLRQTFGDKLTIRTLTSVKRLEVDRTGRVIKLGLEVNKVSPTIHRGDRTLRSALPGVRRENEHTEDVAEGDFVILALPLSQLSALVTPEVALWAPSLPDVRYLRTEPMIALDLYFRRKLTGIPNSITVLLNSNHAMSFLDTSQNWRNGPDDQTWLNVIASTADALIPYRDEEIIRIMLGELKRYIAFDESDIMRCRTHLQTNVGEELFVNQVGSWEWRPQATTGLANLFIAGDYCKTFIDVVTIEGAVVSGLMAAEALRRRAGKGPAIRIRSPDQYPVAAVAAMAHASRPLAYLAYAGSTVDQTLKRSYRNWFPNG